MHNFLLISYTRDERLTGITCKGNKLNYSETHATYQVRQKFMLN